MKKIIVILSLMLLTSFSYSKTLSFIALSDGQYSFVSEQGEQIQVGIRGAIAAIDLGAGNIATAKLTRVNGVKCYKNDKLEITLAFTSYCRGYIKIGNFDQVLYNTVPICN